ncbi:MAG: hypothetical protein Q8N12_00740 [Thermodesulfovibrionales bacterium]|nr:hypothetical protein [Thermodesulfovibrionales bacterium]
MIDAKERDILNSGMKVIWIIWGAMLASLGIYIIVGHMVIAKIKMAEMSPDVFSLLRNALYVVAVIELAIIPFMRKIMLKASPKETQSSAGYQIPGIVTHPALGRYTTVTIVSLALAESIAIYGLLLLLIGKDFQSFYVLTAVSAVAMLVYRPKMDEVEKLAIALKGENFGDYYMRKK